MRGLFLLPALGLLTGCFAPHTDRYQPLPKWEAKFYSQARKDVFPDDARNAPGAYAKTLVAWTGILRQIEQGGDSTSPVVYFTVEHHYFDWLEDHSVQREIYFLSPRGEGLFRCAWRAATDEDRKFVAQFHAGDMVVAYGYPDEVRGNVVGLYPLENIRAVSPAWFRTDILDYGRPGEPSRVLKTAF